MFRVGQRYVHITAGTKDFDPEKTPYWFCTCLAEYKNNSGVKKWIIEDFSSKKMESREHIVGDDEAKNWKPYVPNERKEIVYPELIKEGLDLTWNPSGDVPQ